MAGRFAPFGTTVFAEMTRLADRHGAINLSQGFPDFDGPEVAQEAAHAAMARGENQYAPMPGLGRLREAVAGWCRRAGGLAPDPDREVTVTSGCTGGLAAAFLGLFEPGDRVVLFEPFYDSYRACCAMAGVEARFVTLRPGPQGFAFDEGELRRAFAGGVSGVVLNTPHNPTGKVFTRAELELVAGLCREHDAIVIADEVYERLVYEAEHVSVASLDGMFERTVTLSSLGKTFSLTGWKIGWAVAPEHLTAGIRAAHQFLIYAVPTPLQHGAAAALESGEGYVESLVDRYRSGRDFMAGVLERCGFRVHVPGGSYFIMAEHERVSERLGVSGDVELCRHLTGVIGVAAIPPSAFYADPQRGRGFVRLAFCKRRGTLEAASERLLAALG